jgi:hypothetical protein
MGRVKDVIMEAEDKWNVKADIEGWRCSICAQIPPHCERETFFETGMCAYCLHKTKKDD